MSIVAKACECSWGAHRLQVAGCQAKAVEAYEKAAHANVRGKGTAWHAGKNLEKAAQISKDLQDANACASFAQQAAEHFVSAGKAGSGAECLGRAARWLEGPSPSIAGRLYTDAVALYAKDPMAAMAHDLVQRGVGILVSERQLDQAIEMLMQWASICADTKSGVPLCRAYLGAALPNRLHGWRAWPAPQELQSLHGFTADHRSCCAELRFVRAAHGMTGHARRSD